MRMNRVQAAKRCEELPRFQLKIVGQARSLHEGFFDFDVGFVVVVQLENDVGETFEVRIDGTVKRKLGVPRVETSLLRIMVADLDVMEIGRAGISEREQTIERDVHIS